jgi:hypothetical protein
MVHVHRLVFDATKWVLSYKFRLICMNQKKEAKMKKRLQASFFVRFKIVIWVLMITLFGAAGALTQELSVDIKIFVDGIVVTPTQVENFVAMNVRVNGPNGPIFRTRSTGEVVRWLPAEDFPDGYYRYEVVVLTHKLGGSSSVGEHERSQELTRMRGMFKIQSGLIVIEPEDDSKGGYLGRTAPKSYFDQILGALGYAVNWLLDIGSSSAQALDLEASSTSPKITFTDTQGGGDWRIYVDNQFSGGIFRIFDGPANIVMDVRRSANNDNSILIDAEGDIHLTDGAFMFDKSLSWLGIGTNTQNNNDQITMSGDAPQIGFVDEFDDTTMGIEYSSPWFEIEGTTGNQAIVRIHSEAPDSSLKIDSAGNVSISQGDISLSSSRDMKHDLGLVDLKDVLTRLSELPLHQWQYIDDPKETRHLGPMAEDFFAAFGLGRDNKHISPNDTAGVALAAVQALAKKIECLEKENAELREDLNRLKESHLQSKKMAVKKDNIQ